MPDATKGFSVASVAHLARLGPYPKEREEQLQKELKRILELFDVLQNITTDTPPGTDSTAVTTPLRKDEVKPSPHKEGVLAMFPVKDGPLLKVPKVLE